MVDKTFAVLYYYLELVVISYLKFETTNFHSSKINKFLYFILENWSVHLKIGRVVVSKRLKK